MRVPSGKRVRAARMADVPIGNADWMEAGA